MSNEIIVVIFFLVLYLSLFVWKVWRSIAAQKWPKAEAIIELSHVEKITVTDNFAHDQAQYKPEIQYRYIVCGHTYHSKRFAIGYSDSWSSFVAHQIAARYKEGSHVAISFHPKMHSYSVLVTGVRWMHLLELFVIAILGLIIYQAK